MSSDALRPTDRSQSSELYRVTVTWISSAVVHLIVLCVLTLFVTVSPVTDKMQLALAPRTEVEPWEKEFEVALDLQPLVDETEVVEELVEVERMQEIELAQIDPPTAANMGTAEVLAADQLTAAVDLGELGNRLIPNGQDRQRADDPAAETPSERTFASTHDSSGELGGRAKRRIEFSTPEVDYAIDKGLLWLARHQLRDGGWGFEHRIGECRGRCPNPGSKRGARVAATGLALLPFLGAGQTPEHGEYREVVARGIHFLINNTSRDGSLWQPEGRMYGHGIATLALCECYGILTQSGEQQDDGSSLVDLEQLRQAATAAANFIVQAQAVDGGWRYMPGQLGDTSVVGWQITALKSAADAGLGSYPQTLNAASAFLNSVQLEVAGDPAYGVVGIRYAYKPDRNRSTDATTAIGLTCRMYMGTSPTNPGMKIAVQRIATGGPIEGDLYYNFYANQVVFQHGGPEWESWRAQLVHQLTASQYTQGHLEGSWYFVQGDHGALAGGRLYATAMSCLCLEETFRHLPVFRKNARLRFAERLGAAGGAEANLGAIQAP